MRKAILRNLAAPFRKHGRLESALKITRLANGRSPIVHQLVIPHATYSPWWADADFQGALKEIQGATLVDIYRLYELWSLVGQVQPLTGDILEVGVWRGGSGCLMAAKAKADGLNAQVFLCDTFAGVVKAGDRDTEYIGGEHSDTSAETVTALARRLGLENVEVLTGIFPDETAQPIESRTFRMCHIDVDVYDSARDVFEWAWPRLVPGGVVVFDDFGFHDCDGVTEFVTETGRRVDAFLVHNLNGHAVLVKTGG
jgi:O-methyltransferase